MSMAVSAVAMATAVFFVVYSRHADDSTAARLMHQSA